MSNKKLSIWILGFLTLIICSFFYFRSNRYTISKEKGSISYKIDQWTGDTWVLTGNREVSVEKDEDETSDQVTKEVAIQKVKSAKTLDDDYPAMENESFIEYKFSSLKGDIKISGWKAEKIDNQTYLVSYNYKHQNKTKSYYFELNTKADLIRNIVSGNVDNGDLVRVVSDFDLEKKYELGPFGPPTKEELENARTPEEAFN